MLHRRGLVSHVAQDPHLGGDTLEQAEARKKHAEERQQQAMRQAALDAEQRIETRWPYISPGGKVALTTRLHCTLAILMQCSSLSESGTLH